MNLILQIFPVIFAMMAAFFAIIGGSVIYKKRPVIFNSRIFFGFVLFGFTPAIGMSVYRFFDDSIPGVDFVSILNPLMFLAILIFIWRQMQGYMIIGITDDSLRDSLHFALNELQEDFEEVLTKVKLKNRDTELNLSIQSWIGAGQIRIKNRDKETLRAVTEQMKTYFVKNEVKPKYTTSYFYLIMAVFMLAFAVGMLLLDLPDTVLPMDAMEETGGQD